MTQEVILKIEGAGSEAEEIQESEHEAQAEETEAWRDALSNVTSELAALSQRLESQGSQSSELRQLVETQRQMIADLMESNRASNAQLLETVQNLLTPPPVAIVETPNETPPAEVVAVEPNEVAHSEPEIKVKRFRAI